MTMVNLTEASVYQSKRWFHGLDLPRRRRPVRMKKKVALDASMVRENGEDLMFSDTRRVQLMRTVVIGLTVLVVASRVTEQSEAEPRTIAVGDLSAFEYVLIDPGFALKIDPPGWPDYGSGLGLFLVLCLLLIAG